MTELSYLPLMRIFSHGSYHSSVKCKQSLSGLQLTIIHDKLSVYRKKINADQKRRAYQTEKSHKPRIMEKLKMQNGLTKALYLLIQLYGVKET